MARPAAGSKPKAKNSSVESLRAFKLLTRVDTSYRSGRSPELFSSVLLSAVRPCFDTERDGC
jgi:hypothetical protein